MTAMETIQRLREDVEFARAATNRQRLAAKNARQLLRRLEQCHRQGDREGAVWFIENWREVLERWEREAKEGAR
ncbi:hypothetical protein [Microbacterium caowuchunii]|uniref:Uncharacterized protein n=1 Tax=Microbacterium caowuchunii TaxID=2614638 RepID=A0A5N0TN56_9MICO|nr:hypothetical protein [Microbacterium caowuchunii]KAA9134839.1 hypothetical protein F6B40_03840 [Microbacterium caowuchunii]